MGRFNDHGQGKLEGRKLDPREITIRTEFNFRDMGSEATERHINWLMDSIREHGVQEAIRVQYVKGEIFLVSGHCRVEACKRLFKAGVRVPYKDGGYGPALVPAIVVEGDEAELLAASMIANGGLNPTKLEFGQAADRLLKLGWPIEKVALYIPAHIGLKGSKARRYVTEAVELHQAPLDVKDAVKKGVDGVKVSDAAALAATRGNRMQAGEILRKAAQEAKAKGKTEVKRPKGDGAATISKRDKEISIQKCLQLADSLADVALDNKLDREEVQMCARAYNRARGR